MKKEDYSAEYKTAVALAVLKEDLPLLELAAKYQVHPTLVKKWERQAREGLAAVFSNKNADGPALKSPWDTKVSSMASRLSSEERVYFFCPSANNKRSCGTGESPFSPA